MNRLLDQIMILFVGALFILLVLDLSVLACANAVAVRLESKNSRAEVKEHVNSLLAEVNNGDTLMQECFLAARLSDRLKSIRSDQQVTGTRLEMEKLRVANIAISQAGCYRAKQAISRFSAYAECLFSAGKLSDYPFSEKEKYIFETVLLLKNDKPEPDPANETAQVFSELQILEKSIAEYLTFSTPKTAHTGDPISY